MRSQRDKIIKQNGIARKTGYIFYAQNIVISKYLVIGIEKGEDEVYNKFIKLYRKLIVSQLKPDNRSVRGFLCMKIKLAILESDLNYLKRIVSVLNTKFADKLEVYSFTDKEVALAILGKERINVLIANESFEIKTEEVPKQCSFAYLVNSSDIDSVNNQKAICKFQKVDLIYREILRLYSENAGNTSTMKYIDDKCRVIMFSSPTGGVGNSTMAAACAVRCAKQGKKVLYLNLEKLGSADTFFSAEGVSNMGDVLFALKSKQTKLSFKLESCVKRDRNGVYFYSQSKYALDMAEPSGDDWIQLINVLRSSGFYEYIIVDMDFNLDEEYLKMYEQMNAVVWVDNGTDIANGKTYRAYQSCKMIESESRLSVIGNIVFVYNKFSNKSCKVIDGELGVESIGGAPTYLNVPSEDIIEQLSAMAFFDRVL